MIYVWPILLAFGTIYIVDVPPKFGTNKYSCRDQNLLEIPHPSHLLYEYEWMDSSEKLTQIIIPPIGSLLM
jgi:hypothetical protein